MAEDGDLPELNFQGLSLHEMAVQLSSLSEARRSRSAQQTQNHTQAPLAPRDPVNTSQLFNSQDELILSRLSEWTDSDPDDNEDAKSDASDVSSASTESITLSVLKPEHPEPNTLIFDSILTTSTGYYDFDDDGPSSLQPQPLTSLDNPKRTEKLDDHDQYDGDISNCVDWNNDGASESAASSSAPTFKAKFHAVPNYGCRVSPGFGYQGLNVLKPSASSGWRIIPGTEDEQIFTRAPNFRTPGGYKPPEFEKDPRMLSDSEVHDEVREMYAEAAAAKELESQILPKVVSSVIVTSPEANKSISEGGEGDSKRDKPKQESPKQKQTPTTPKATPVKRRLYNEKMNGDGDAPLPSLNLGNTDFPEVEVEEPLVTRGKSYLCYDAENPEVDSPSRQDINRPYTGDISRCLPRRISKRLSPESRKVNLLELDRLWKDIQDTKHKMEHDMESLRNTEDPFTCGPGPSGACAKTNTNRPGSAPDPNQPLSPILNRDLSSDLEKLVLSPNKFIEPLPLPKTKTPNKVSFSDPTHPPPQKIPGSASSKSRPKKLTKKVGSRGKSIPIQKKPKKATSSKEASVVSVDDSEEELVIPFIPRELQDVELSTLLKETDLEESDLDDILNQITEYHPPGHLFNEEESPVELTSALQQLQISDWAKSGAGEYVEKFYEEKYKRQHCEKEVLGLQKKLLEFKERVAVLEGILKTKEFTVHKYTKLWECLVKQWRDHEKGCKLKTSRLETENSALKAQVNESKGRIGEYEQELGKALQLSSDFKKQIDEALENNEKEKQDWLEEKKEFQLKLEHLDITLREGKAGKEATMRALRECQAVLDKTRANLQVSHEQVTVLRAQSTNDSSKISKLVDEKEKLESTFSEVKKEKETLETDFAQTKVELEKEKKENELLEFKLRAEKDKLSQDAMRLHDYYNTQVKEILASQSEKIVAAEKIFIQSHENKLKLLQETSERRMEELHKKYRQENQLMKSHFDSQMEVLRRDNEEKRTLIGNVSQQFRSYSEKDSRDVSFQPDPHPVKLSELELFENVLSMKKSGNIPGPGPAFLESSQATSHCISSLVYAYNEKKHQKNHKTNGRHLDPN